MKFLVCLALAVACLFVGDVQQSEAGWLFPNRVTRSVRVVTNRTRTVQRVEVRVPVQVIRSRSVMRSSCSSGQCPR